MLYSPPPRTQSASRARGGITHACSSDAILPMQAMAVPRREMLRQTSHLICWSRYLYRRGKYIQKVSNRTVLGQVLQYNIDQVLSCDCLPISIIRRFLQIPQKAAALPVSPSLDGREVKVSAKLWGKGFHYHLRAFWKKIGSATRFTRA
jgi:hypothetical protein